jgi:hypothetical protein
MANASWLKPSNVSSVNSLFILGCSLYSWIEFYLNSNPTKEQKIIKSKNKMQKMTTIPGSCYPIWLPMRAHSARC